MAIQLSFLWLMVSIAVASTRLIYHDGISCQFERMASHCRMLAVLIVAMTVYSGSIGFSIHEQCMRDIKQKDNQMKGRAIANQTFTEQNEAFESLILSSSGL